MTINEFENYKTLANKVIDLLIEEQHSSLNDIKIIYNILMGFPYCISTSGQYTYHGEFYNSFDELPNEAKESILYNAYKLKCRPYFMKNELPKIRKSK